MKTATRSINQIVEEQVQRWHILKKEKKDEESIPPVITISREPGSGGWVIAEKLAKKLGYDLFHQEMINEMAKGANVSNRVIETLDEKGLSVLEEWITSLVEMQHLWPDQYLHILMKVIGTIGRHGHAVIVGRGANFMLLPERTLKVRIVAPLDMRINNFSRDQGVSLEEGKRRLIKAESDRRSFIRKYFNANVSDIMHYDLILNTGKMTADIAVQTIKAAAGL